MKKLTTMFVAFLVVASTSFAAFAGPDPVKDGKAAIAELNASAHAAVSKAQWDIFSKNLVNALKTDHDGLRAAALQMIIQYGNRVTVDDAVFDVMRLYRNHENPQMQRLALVALGNMDNTWAIGFLRLSKDYEKSPALLHTINAIIQVSEDRGVALSH